MQNEERIYRNYIADSIFYYADNKRMTVKYHDILNPPKVDNRSVEEIINDTLTRAGITKKGGDK